MKKALFFFGIENIPEIKLNDNLGEIIVQSTEQVKGIQSNDVCIIASKIVSKSEGTIIPFEAIIPSRQAKYLSKKSGKDPRICQCQVPIFSDIFLREFA